MNLNFFQGEMSRISRDSHHCQLLVGADDDHHDDDDETLCSDCGWEKSLINPIITDNLLSFADFLLLNFVI